MFLESPLSAFSNFMDKKLRNQTIYDYYDYIEGIQPEKIGNLFLSEIQYRANNQLNILIETYGQQGSGKSLFSIGWAFKIAEIYGVPFEMKTNITVDFDDLDIILHNSPFRSTFVVDEQPTNFIGYGSVSTKNSLKDFEEMARFTQKNIVYIAPTEREHASYFVFKEDEKKSVERINNPRCLACLKKNDCLGKIHLNKFKTLCDLPFWERHGYPKHFNFLLLSHRKTDNYLMPRGYIEIPVLSHEKMIEYDSIKIKNIDALDKKESSAWEKQRKQLSDFSKKYEPHLITVVKKREKIIQNNDVFFETRKEKKVVSMNTIKGLLMDFFGKRRFTTTELEIMAALIKAETQEKIQEEQED